MAWMIDGNKLKQKAVPLLFPTDMEPCGHLPNPVQAVTISEVEHMIYAEAVELKTGEWIDRGYEVECPFCGFTCNDMHYLGKAIACPNCAATMDV